LYKIKIINLKRGKSYFGLVSEVLVHVWLAPFFWVVARQHIMVDCLMTGKEKERKRPMTSNPFKSILSMT
jgi:hypothetical protein